MVDFYFYLFLVLVFCIYSDHMLYMYTVRLFPCPGNFLLYSCFQFFVIELNKREGLGSVSDCYQQFVCVGLSFVSVLYPSHS